MSVWRIGREGEGK